MNTTYRYIHEDYPHMSSIMCSNILLVCPFQITFDWFVFHMFLWLQKCCECLHWPYCFIRRYTEIAEECRSCDRTINVIVYLIGYQTHTTTWPITDVFIQTSAGGKQTWDKLCKPGGFGSFLTWFRRQVTD